MSDQAVADPYYQQIDQFIRVLGADQVGRTEVFFRLSRAVIGAGIDHSELQRILPRITSLAAWYDAWKTSADRFVHLGEAAERAGHRVSAGEHLLRGALLYHFAQVFTRPEDTRRIEGQRLRVVYYRRAAPYLTPPVEPVHIAFGRLRIPGYLRLPLTAARPAPIAIQIPGASSVKEELHHWGTDLLKRGIATLAIDGPGQGELSVRAGGVPLRLDAFSEAISAVIDDLAKRPDIDSSRVALWGQSTGGNLALMAAAREPHVRAVVALSGGFDFRRKTAPNTPVDVREEARDLYGLSSFNELEAYLRREGSLEGRLGNLRCPVLLVHGGRDPLVAAEELERIRTEAGGPVHVHVYEDGGHSVCNRNLEMSPAMADWLADHLVAERAVTDRSIADRSS